MSEPFLAEVKIFGFDFAPRGWAFCDGQILPINQNQSLFSLVGTTYGGDGRTTFGLPDLRGRSPIHVGNSSTSESTNHTLGQKSGQENHLLSGQETPQHTHDFNVATTDATLQQNPPPSGGGVLAKANLNMYHPGGGTQQALDRTSISTVGGQGHENMQPYLALNFCIALSGLFPARN
jgi:microcystin-dependent protein